MNTESLQNFFSKPKLILGLYILLAVIFSILNYQKGQTKQFSPNDKYTHYNNYVIFKNAYFNLKEGKNLYIHYPEKQWDLYKYSPSFAAAMMALAYIPDWLGLLLWNLINVLVLFYGVRYFIKGPPHTIFMLWFIFNELVTSVINSQSNLMITGLLVAAFTFLRKTKFIGRHYVLSLHFISKYLEYWLVCFFCFIPIKANLFCGVLLGRL